MDRVKLLQDLSTLQPIVDYALLRLANPHAKPQKPNMATFDFIRESVFHFNTLLSLLNIYESTKDFTLPTPNTPAENWMHLRNLFRRIGESATGKQNHALKHYNEDLYEQLIELRDTFCHVEVLHNLNQSVGMQSSVDPVLVTQQIIPLIHASIKKVIEHYLDDHCPLTLETEYKKAFNFDEKWQNQLPEFLKNYQNDTYFDYVNINLPHLKLFERIEGFFHSGNQSDINTLRSDLGKFKKEESLDTSSIRWVLSNINKIAHERKTLFETLYSEYNHYVDTIKQKKRAENPRIELIDTLLLKAKYTSIPTEALETKLNYCKQRINDLYNLLAQLNDEVNHTQEITQLEEDGEYNMEALFYFEGLIPPRKAFVREYSTNCYFKSIVDDALIEIVTILIGNGKNGLGDKMDPRCALADQFKTLRQQFTRMRADLAHTDPLINDDVFQPGLFFDKNMIKQYLIERKKPFTDKSALIDDFITTHLPLVQAICEQLSKQLEAKKAITPGYAVATSNAMGITQASLTTPLWQDSSKSKP